MVIREKVAFSVSEKATEKYFGKSKRNIQSNQVLWLVLYG